MNSVRTAFFLVVRYIRGSSVFSTILIVFVMFLIFLNLTLVGGVLEGLVQGSFQDFRENYAGDIFLDAVSGRPYIDTPAEVSTILDSEEYIETYSKRWVPGRVEIVEEQEFYNVLNDKEERDVISATAFGVIPEEEDRVTNLSQHIMPGTFLNSADRGWVLLGSALFVENNPFGDFGIKNAQVGDSVFVRFPSQERYKKFRIKGVLDAKGGEWELSALFVLDDVRPYLGNRIANEFDIVAVRTTSPDIAPQVKQSLLNKGLGAYAEVQVADEAIGRFLDQIRDVFSLLGLVIGFIGIIVGSVVTFILIYVLTTSRKQSIGILKGIGIAPSSILLSFVFLAFFYGFLGSLFGMMVLYFGVVPYFDANPIQFPFSDGIVYAPLTTVLPRLGILLVATTLAGFIPAYLTVRKPAIKAIAGR